MRRTVISNGLPTIGNLSDGRVWLALALTVAVLAPQPLAGQRWPTRPGGTFRTTLGVTPLFPVDSGFNSNTLFTGERLPSGRATLDVQLSPWFGLQVGGLRLASPDYALWSGVLGLRMNLLKGRFRIAPFAEGGYGLLEARVDSGGYTYFDDQGVEQYRPYYRPVTGPAYGGGGGVQTELIMGPGMTLHLMGGYYHFRSGNGNTISEPFAGVGLKLAFRDDTWFWRTQGRDQDYPQLIFLNPTPDSSGYLPIRGRPLRFVASDLSGVEGIWINGELVPMAEATGIPADVERDLQGEAVRVDMVVPLAAVDEQVSIILQDGAGNTRRERFRVEAFEVDEAGPTVAIIQPGPGTIVEAAEAMLIGQVSDASPVTEITVNGEPVNLLDAVDADARGLTASPADTTTYFEANVALEPGANSVVVAAVDSAGNRNEITHNVVRRAVVAAQPIPGTVDTEGPAIQIEEPREWSGAGLRGVGVEPKSSIRVVGTARDPTGVQEVRINGKSAALQQLGSNNTVVRFVGYAGAETDDGEVEVAAWSNQGVLSAKLFRYRANAAVVEEAPDLAEDGLIGERFAVIVGISEYAAEGVPDLRYADDDAEAFYRFLTSEEAGLGGIAEENVRLLLNEEATYREMRSALYTFLEQATDKDVVYIFIAAHGAPNPNRVDDLYILPYDSEPDDIPGTGFPMSDVNESIRRLYARHTVLLTDACHSGGVGMGSYASRAMDDASMNAINQVFLQDLNSVNGGLAILTASEARQLSREGTQWGGGHGVFTWYLLEGLRGRADLDHDRIVRLGELMEYVRDSVRRETRNGQIPSIGSQSHDRFLPMSIVTSEPQ